MQHMKVSADLFRAMCIEAGVPITRSEQKLLKAMTDKGGFNPWRFAALTVVTKNEKRILDMAIEIAEMGAMNERGVKLKHETI